MSSDHRRLRVFHDAHSLTLAIYKHTKGFREKNGSAYGSKCDALLHPRQAISSKEVRAERRRTIANVSHMHWEPHVK